MLRWIMTNTKVLAKQSKDINDFEVYISSQESK